MIYSQKSIRSSYESIDSSNYELPPMKRINKPIMQLPSQKYRQYQNGASQETLQDEQNLSRYRDYLEKKYTIKRNSDTE